jgi:hypothetical protein
MMLQILHLAWDIMDFAIFTSVTGRIYGREQGKEDL